MSNSNLNYEWHVLSKQEHAEKQSEWAAHETPIMSSRLFAIHRHDFNFRGVYARGVGFFFPSKNIECTELNETSTRIQTTGLNLPPPVGCYDRLSCSEYYSAHASFSLGLCSIEQFAPVLYHVSEIEIPDMQVWGGENLELSFKCWLCGGCSAWIVLRCGVGHVFRTETPYPIEEELIRSNRVRVAEIWMDNFKYLLYDR